MSYPKLCEYKGWMKKGGGNCFRLQNSIKSPRQRCDGPTGCVWRSQRINSSMKSPSRTGSKSPPKCVWGKRSIYNDKVGTCYNRNAVRFDKSGWKKCNYPSKCVNPKKYGQKIWKKNINDDEDVEIEILKSEMTCNDLYFFNKTTRLSSDERDFLNTVEQIENIDKIIQYFKPDDIPKFLTILKKIDIEYLNSKNCKDDLKKKKIKFLSDFKEKLLKLNK